MKLKKYIPLLLCAALLCSLLAIPAAASLTLSSYESVGLSLSSSIGTSSEESTPVPFATGSQDSSDEGNTPSSEKGIDNDNIVTQKTVSGPNIDGTYTIRMEAYVTGTVKSETVIISEPCDIVIVVDQSSKLMNKAFTNSNGTTSTVGNEIKNALTNFVNGLSGNHRIAIVTFASGGSGIPGEWCSLSDTENINFNINKISVDGQSAQSIHETGVTRAGTLFNTAREGAKKVVVFISAGEPGNKNFDESAASEALEAATYVKNSATFYTVGIFDGADGKNVATGSSDTDTKNKYCHYLSSNYPDAMSMSNPGIPAFPENGSYFLTAATSEGLNTAFDTITQNIQSGSSNIQLEQSTVMIDTVPAFFKIPEGNSSITCYTAKAKYDDKGNLTGWEKEENSSSALTIKPNDEDGTISVEGFDYAENYVAYPGRAEGNSFQSGNFYGRKLVVEFTIKPDYSKTFGGSDIPTNIGTRSGIIGEDGTVYENFNVSGETIQVPTASVPLKYEIASQHQTIYLSDNVNLTNLIAYASGFEPDGTNNKYVTITYTIDGKKYVIAPGETEGSWQDGANPVVGDLTECKPYEISCTVTSGTMELTQQATAIVHVVKPTITNSDTTVYLSNSIDLNTQMQEAAVWTCSHSGVSLPVTEDSARVAPMVDYTFAGVADETAYAPDACADITVSATVGTNETPFALADNSFKVHVLKPTVVAEEKTIWQSESVTSTATVTGWNCACTDVTHTMHADSEKPNETITMPEVKPDDCTKYTATYTVGDTDFTADYWVHVLTADLSMSDPVIYLSQTVAFADHDTVTWETQCEHGKRLTSDAPAASAVVGGEASAAPKTCMDYKADLKIGKTVYTKNVPFTVHVVCPEVTATDATIKLGNKAPETGHVVWEMESGGLTSGKFICECDDHHNANAMPNTKPVLSVQHAGTEYPTACSNNGHKATALIDGVLWEDYYANYTVHVQTPEVTGKTDTIYQGQDYDLTSTVTWKKCAHDKALTNESEQDPAAITTYQIKNLEGSFIDAGTKANYDACSDYKVTYQPTNVPNSFTGEFTVHVLIPTFTVETQDLWADLGTNVTLFTTATTDVDAVKSCGSSWIYSGANCGHQNPPAAADLPAGAPDVAVTKVAFNEGEAAAIKEQDVSVTANAVTYTVNGKTYTAGNDRLTGSLIAKLHANTFILKVVNSSAQNGIFTLKQGNTALYDVAVPGNSDTTTIAGLYCTKPYNLDETTGNAWSWRYNTAVKSNEAVHAKPGFVATENCNAVVEVTVNYGDTQDNAKWLADEDCVINNAATPNCTIPVKKEDDEEVTGA